MFNRLKLAFHSLFSSSDKIFFHAEKFKSQKGKKFLCISSTANNILDLSEDNISITASSRLNSTLLVDLVISSLKVKSLKLNSYYKTILAMKSSLILLSDLYLDKIELNIYDENKNTNEDIIQALSASSINKLLDVNNSEFLLNFQYIQELFKTLTTLILRAEYKLPLPEYSNIIDNLKHIDDAIINNDLQLTNSEFWIFKGKNMFSEKIPNTEVFSNIRDMERKKYA